MLFNSLNFLVFFTLLFAIYWSVRKHLQNLLLLTASYVFYGFADWRFLFLLIGISAAVFFLAIGMEKAEGTARASLKKLFFSLGLTLSIGSLAFFKYFNFFTASFNDLLRGVGIHSQLETLHIIVPLGISFFTFRVLSYLFDVNNGKTRPTRDWVVFFNYVSFFPSLLAGPIDRAKLFIPQLEKQRSFTYSEGVNGLRQILYGLFKKMVIADRCAEFANTIFTNYTNYHGITLILGAIIFTIQIYADFSGYSDMALGIARLLGFHITKNFDFPFFSENIAEFWRKWNISLTSWLTDYLFTPLSISFRNWGKTGLVLAILITFTICGVWHGASWTYVLFGFVHGCYYIPLILTGAMTKKKKKIQDRALPSFSQFFNMILTFILVSLAFILFRSDTVSDAAGYYKRILHLWPVARPEISVSLLLLAGIFLLLEWIGRNSEYAIEKTGLNWSKTGRWAFYLAIFIVIFLYQGKPLAFIYFQF
ncbi:MAG: MBOAT family protein [Chitinophagaceae bacterium]|nr:MBOAT family protein [Chitinophagaceae bacterium]